MKDVANGICNAISLGKSGECYILANENLTFSRFADVLGKVEGIPKKKIISPEAFLNALGATGNLFTSIGIKTNLNLVNTRILNINNFYSAAKAIQEINLPQTSIEDAISDALKWWWKMDG